ncbi:non-ribosomal peptide synthetase [Marinobacterium sp. D7]|uniref:non-ribosomal peptide synthetase n=1 Tax=Marinobacterium ramblicola TaxID=2849041 RepID=UPI001C2CF691|nr:non-ribosomal peptide synthetase [Marinobacterium ramblicola]MBV1787462.1 non-ribosomal peptide synthetase [Marinobacterium ramblicola]
MEDLTPSVRTFDAVHILVQRACKAHAKRIALCEGYSRISYAKLHKTVQKIKADIEASAVVAGSIVAVIAQSSAQAIATALAVWDADCTLMLIDSGLPAERQQAMLSAVPTRGVIRCQAQESLIEVVEPPTEECASIFEKAGSDYAYIAFTSGSTGKPKAIVGSHNGLSQFLDWQRSEFSIRPDDRFAQFTNLSFDVWFRDVFTPLISGATVCIPEQRQLGAQAALSFIRENAITAVHMVPSIARLWVTQQAGEPAIESLRYTFFAGEPLDAGLVTQWTNLFPDSQVINLYGPTETTLAKHFKRLIMPLADGIQAVGNPIEGAISFVLAEDGTTCGVGETGEICIATPYCSHGYFADGALISPFVAGVFAPDPSLAVYRTGDIGRTNPDNEIEILGRQDDQIKINGVRIDLGEVKSVILAFPGINTVFVCARNTRFTKTIIAFVESETCAVDELMDYLRARLPSVMLPSDVHVHGALPRLPNGKLDRKRLTELANKPIEFAANTHRDENRSAIQRLENVWREVLERQHLSRSQNFFDLGGNSLSIVVLHEQLQREFNVKIPLVRLFQYSTINSQVDLVRAHGDETTALRATRNDLPSAPRLVHRRSLIASRARRTNQESVQ